MHTTADYLIFRKKNFFNFFSIYVILQIVWLILKQLEIIHLTLGLR
jgi:hypothetical protein